ncbi:hypothetical protein Lgee_0981 [Legionella geestiana]|uniref:Uncharacterized protein n=1 Tax=Legionella geestiana TaxID=45065 RepID=A0A0W0TZ66_9GAMM|nr:hypothetical protein [Legionella geestiana]KTD00717.1 hypothetical protein Lgee_0981 [Legionella geestiana]QBS11577.1 hypothetical protein E4T54_01825 [Legionella geestiana]QDQ40815.1 hypothetical protein E3226_010610 [Legionella geestiana]STX53748.1 Uncharacterised protein [Legionella geestiana]
MQKDDENDTLVEETYLRIREYLAEKAEKKEPTVDMYDMIVLEKGKTPITIHVKLLDLLKSTLHSAKPRIHEPLTNEALGSSEDQPSAGIHYQK